MRQRSFRARRLAVAWTLLMLAVAIVLAVQAAVSLYDGQQACFFDYPATACPSNDDPAIARLTFAFFGVPAVWLGGIGLGILVWSWRRRRGAPTPS